MFAERHRRIGLPREANGGVGGRSTGAEVQPVIVLKRLDIDTVGARYKEAIGAFGFVEI